MDGYHLLSAADRAYASSTGIRCEDASELFTVQADGRLVFSVKGLQFLKFACAAHQLPYLPASLKTQRDLFELAIEMSRVRVSRLQADTSAKLQAGQVPAQERDFARAVLEQGLSASLAAAERHDACAQAGDNVLPLSTRRSSS